MRSRPGRRELIDFASGRSSIDVDVVRQDRFGAVSLAQLTLPENSGAIITSPQITIVAHLSEGFQMDWRAPGSDRLRTSTVQRGLYHVADSRLDLWQRWKGNPEIFVFAIDEILIDRIWKAAFSGVGRHSIETSIAIDDVVVRQLINRGRLELTANNPGIDLIFESLANEFAVHLLRNYGSGRRLPTPHKGGLAPGQLRRVTEYIHENLTTRLSLAELAGVAGLSSHHFGDAFKTSVGTPPHRYVVERRVEYAAALLQKSDRPIAEIAFAAGFSSQSHLTAAFRRVKGTTPFRFRRLLR